MASPIQRHWLTRAGALTAGLRELGTLELRVIRQTTLPPQTDERAAMGLAAKQPLHVREICMSINGQDCVVARSTVSLQAKFGAWQAISHLGRRPLADILYDDRRVSRSGFETARIRTPHQLARLALACGPQSLANARLALWARRSVFRRGGEALLVSECFLPTFWEIAHSRWRTNR